MAGVQTSVDVNTRPFLLEANHTLRDDEAVLLQNGGRSGDILSRTLMAQIAATKKYVPYTNAAATDGTAIPVGIYDPEGELGPILEADIQAGDVVDLPIILFGGDFDRDRLVIENALTLDTVIAGGTIAAQTVEQALRKISLNAVEAESGSRAEN